MFARLGHVLYLVLHSHYSDIIVFVVVAVASLVLGFDNTTAMLFGIVALITCEGLRAVIRRDGWKKALQNILVIYSVLGALIYLGSRFRR
jgi:hypothetical protein